MKTANITKEKSIEENLETWCYEVGSRFEAASFDAARQFDFLRNNLNLPKRVVDLGSGDGAASNWFIENNYEVWSVDINKNKLDKSCWTKSFNMDIEEFLDTTNIEDFSVFTHHSLEHLVHAENVINKIGEKINKKSLYYAIVPAGDHLHSVHHTVFEDPFELLPPQMTPLLMTAQRRFEEDEFICVAVK